MSRKIVCFLTATLVALSIPAFASTAQADSADGFNYTLDVEGMATVTGCVNACPAKLVIPVFLGGNPVNYIGSWAFDNEALTSVTIPTSIFRVEEGAFSGNNLKAVRIPDSVNFIGENAFSANQLTSVTIGASVLDIGEASFFNNKLTSVTIPNSVTSLGRSAFEMNQLSSVTIGTSVTTISAHAFNTNLLTSVTIPGSVTTIEEGAFLNNQLNSVTISEGVTAIRTDAFATNQLTTITIPKSVAAIGKDAFATNQLTSVTFKGHAPDAAFAIFGGNLNLTSIVVPSDASGWTATFSGVNVNPSGERMVPAVAPSYVSAAKISGTAKAGSTLTVKPGTWSGTANIAFTYQWYSCSKAVKSAIKAGKTPTTCKLISKATKSTLKLASKQKASFVTVLITATNLAGKTNLLPPTLGATK